jgi:hypothetical protein
MGGAVIVIENDASWKTKIAEAAAEGKTVCAQWHRDALRTLRSCCLLRAPHLQRGVAARS